MDVEIRTTGDPEPLDPSVSLASFRAVQEALLRHSGAGTHAIVEVTWSRELLTLCVFDDGHGSTDPGLAALSTGTGLVGLRERVTIAGGHLECGPRPGGGWRLEVALPVTDATLRPSPVGRRASRVQGCADRG